MGVWPAEELTWPEPSQYYSTSSGFCAEGQIGEITNSQGGHYSNTRMHGRLHCMSMSDRKIIVVKNL